MAARASAETTRYVMPHLAAPQARRARAGARRAAARHILGAAAVECNRGLCAVPCRADRRVACGAPRAVRDGAVRAGGRADVHAVQLELGVGFARVWVVLQVDARAQEAVARRSVVLRVRAYERVPPALRVARRGAVRRETAGRRPGWTGRSALVHLLVDLPKVLDANSYHPLILTGGRVVKSAHPVAVVEFVAAVVPQESGSAHRFNGLRPPMVHELLASTVIHCAIGHILVTISTRRPRRTRSNQRGRD